MHYKRKAHRGRHKVNVMDNQAHRCAGNSASKQAGFGAPSKKVHQSATHRNRVAMYEVA